ncbi:MAG: hypothetical protein F6J99_36800 [Moorea sp. SIO4G3]|nr:hypothetical protein [Moorena sp. SIO4G3]
MANLIRLRKAHSLGVVRRLIVGWAVPSNAMASFGIGLVHCPPYINYINLTTST